MLSAYSSLKGAERLGRDELLRDIAPLGLMIAVLQNFSSLLPVSDRLVLGFLADPSSALSEVAIYSVLTTLATVLFVFPSSVGGIFLPVFSRLAGKNERDRMREVIDSSLRWTLMIAVPVGITMMVLSKEILSLFYGPSYASGALALSIFSAGMIISAASHILWLALAGLRMITVELVVAAASGLLNIALAFALVPSFGMEGAAAASAAGFICSFILLLHYCGGLLSYRPGPHALRLFIPSVLTLAALLLLRPVLSPLLPESSESLEGRILSLAAIGALTAVSYALFGLMAVFSGCFTEEDKGLAERALLRAGLPPAWAAKIAGLL